MEEKTVKKVFREYLKKTEKSFEEKPLSAPGPDILTGGECIEYKGSKFDKSRTIKQTVSYFLKYKSLAIVFPDDFIGLRNFIDFPLLYKLMTIDCSNRYSSIKIYSISETAKENEYAICRFDSIYSLINELNSILYKLCGTIVEKCAEIQELGKKKREILKFLKTETSINKIKRVLRNSIIGKAKESTNPLKAILIQI